MKVALLLLLLLLTSFFSSAFPLAFLSTMLRFIALIFKMTTIVVAVCCASPSMNYTHIRTHAYSQLVRAPFTFLPHFPPWQHFCICVECIFNGILIAIGTVIAIFSLIAAKNTALRIARTPVRATTHTPTHTHALLSVSMSLRRKHSEN